MPITTKNQTGSLRYQKILPNGEIIHPEFSLWINHLQQDNQLIGPLAQSRNTRHFYPRSFGPGDMVIEGVSPDQRSYQELAVFIRSHQEYILNNFNLTLETGSSTNISQYDGLMRLSIPNENIYMFGWIGKFMLQKKGVFEPAPTWHFNFTIARDENTSNSVTSFVIKDQFTGKDITVQKIINTWTAPTNLP